MAARAYGLTAIKVDKVKEPGYYGDGGGLYLQVAPSGARTWIYRFQLGGRRREMGIGSAALISLANARAKAFELKKLVSEGVDPIEQKRLAEAAAKAEPADAITFETCAETYIATHRASWRNEKHAAQWPSSLKLYAYPVFGALPVSAINADLVMKAVEPIWATKTETASRVRQRIETVLDWARVRGYRDGENPARWKGHLDHLLPARNKVARVEHHAALPYADMPKFFLRLQAADGLGARALELAILTAARTGEVLGATWPEFDLAGALWTIPARRMKAGREHRVPLSDIALTLLRKLHTIRDGDFVFPGLKKAKPLSNMALLMTLRRMDRDDLTAHGFRSTLRDWVAERTNFPHELAEMALAHVLENKVEAAYQRGDKLDRRRKLMDAWARYCQTPLAAPMGLSLHGVAPSGGPRDNPSGGEAPDANMPLTHSINRVNE